MTMKTKFMSLSENVISRVTRKAEERKIISCYAITLLLGVHCTYMRRYGLLRQMSHVAWSVCVSVCWASVSVAHKWVNRSRCRLGAESRGSKEKL